MSELKDIEIKKWLVTVKYGTHLSVFDSTVSGQSQSWYPNHPKILNMYAFCSMPCVLQMETWTEQGMIHTSILFKCTVTAHRLDS